MTAGPPIAKIASLIGEPARALMLTALLDDRSRTAGELARVSGVTPQTASAHIAKLTQAGLITVQNQGRHRYHRLASSDVALALEALMTIAPTATLKHRLGPTDANLRHARSCYDHMAGEVAVQVASISIERGWINISSDHWKLEPPHCRSWESFFLTRRSAGRPCVLAWIGASVACTSPANSAPASFVHSWRRDGSKPSLALGS